MSDEKLTQSKEKTFTQDEVNKIIEKRLSKVKELDLIQKEKKELAELRKFKNDFDLQVSMDKLLKSDEVQDMGIHPSGQKRFIKEFYDRLKDKTGETLVAEINQIKQDEENAFYFLETNPKASESLKEAIETPKEPEQKDEFYPGSTIRKRK